MQTEEPQVNADSLLARLEGVRQRSSGQWSARCPAHDDGSPSLSVKETQDGRLLLHCFGGCRVDAVTDALGIRLEDLFPPAADRAPVERRSLITAGQALELLAHESLLAATAAGNLANGVRLTPNDRQRLFQAAGRISYLRSQIPK